MSNNSQLPKYVIEVPSPPAANAPVQEQPRGGPLDQSGAMSLPPVPGGAEANADAEYRSRLIAASEAVKARSINNGIKGLLHGLLVGVVALFLFWRGKSQSQGGE